MDMLLKLTEDHGTTLVLITHDEALASYTDRNLVMQDGSLEALDVSVNLLEGTIPTHLCSLNGSLAFDCSDDLCGCNCP